MPNKNYLKGKAKEQRLVVKYREKGFDIVQRSAGSHSPIDIFAINRKLKTIVFIQSKPKKFSANAKQKLLDEFGWMNDEFVCKFVVL